MFKIQLFTFVACSYLMVFASAKPQIASPYYSYPNNYGARFIPQLVNTNPAVQPLNPIRTDVPEVKIGSTSLHQKSQQPILTPSSVTGNEVFHFFFILM